jgi:hypothetical protein
MKQLMHRSIHAATVAATAAVCAMLLTACERVVDITVPDGPTRLVVEGRVEAVVGRPSGRQQVILTTTAPYFQQTAAPPARGAQVSIADETGRVVPLAESATAPGHYITENLVARVGGRYTLRIRWQGDEYEAEDTLLPVAPIDSLYFTKRSFLGFGRPEDEDTLPRVTIDMRDPAGASNYYLWDLYVDGQRVLVSDSVLRHRAVDTDQYFDGLRIRSYQTHPDTPIRPGQMVLLRQQSLSEQQYRFYRTLNDQMIGNGSPFSIPPTSVRGNISNRTRPEVRALGIFMATNVVEGLIRAP